MGPSGHTLPALRWRPDSGPRPATLSPSSPPCQAALLKKACGGRCRSRRPTLSPHNCDTPWTCPPARGGGVLGQVPVSVCKCTRLGAGLAQRRIKTRSQAPQRGPAGYSQKPAGGGGGCILAPPSGSTGLAGPDPQPLACMAEGGARLRHVQGVLGSVRTRGSHSVSRNQRVSRCSL